MSPEETAQGPKAGGEGEKRHEEDQYLIRRILTEGEV
jgi:hypothetical protein